jgi:hypothetical protein
MESARLVETLNLFDPQRPLQMDELDDYYVLRPYAPLEPMKTYVRVNRQPVKVLFSGHRGSGKSTELRRLSKDLDDEFFIVHVHAASLLNLADLNYADIVLACASALFREATDRARKVKVPAKLWRQVLDWLTSEITNETTISAPASGAISAKLNALIFSIEGKYGRESTTRSTMRERLLPRLNDLIEQANDICDKIEEATGKPPLIIVEDIDKTDLGHARDLFFEHSTSLNSMSCRIIYTFPIALCYSNSFTERIGDYSKHFLLPNISIYKTDGRPNPECCDALKEVITRRITEAIFSESALDDIIKLSGGLMRDLVRLVGDSALLALTEGAPGITPDTVHQVAAEMTNSYRRLLQPQHYEALREAHSTKQIIPNETVRQLLENLSLLEYRNTNSWCDVHPLAQSLL